MPDPASESLKILFVLNPISGGKSKKNWETGIREYFKHTEHKIEFYNTNGLSDHHSITHWVGEWKPNIVVAVGGDGTLKLVAEVMQGSDTPLAVFPAGSANGMAREVGMSNDIAGCISILLAGHTRRIDMIRINNQHLSLHLSDIGLNAQLVKYFEENDVRGIMGYGREVFKVLWRRRLLPVIIRKGNDRIRREAFMVVLANARMYGTGAMINPGGNISDGIFEVVILRKLSFIELFKMLFLNRPFNPQKIEVLAAEAVTIEVKRKAYFQVDGEYLGKTKRITAKIEPSALLMIVPESNLKITGVPPK